MRFWAVTEFKKLAWHVGHAFWFEEGFSKSFGDVFDVLE